jgi:hypothetical protein
VIILFTGVIFPDYLIPKVISDYLSIAFREKLMITVAKHVSDLSFDFQCSDISSFFFRTKHVSLSNSSKFG